MIDFFYGIARSNGRLRNIRFWDYRFNRSDQRDETVGRPNCPITFSVVGTMRNLPLNLGLIRDRAVKAWANHNNGIDIAMTAT
jgi:hypothetical protein